MSNESDQIIFEGVKDNFLEFGKRFFFPYLDSPYKEESFHQEWNEMINARDPIDKPNRKMLRFLEEISRGAGKTEFLTIQLSIFDAVTGKYMIQVVGAVTNGQTKEHADKIKRTLLKSPYLK